jgi:HD superfamily phosphodiesterase
MDSPLATAADALLAKVSPPALANHCKRTFVFGTELLRQAGRAYDAEAFYVAAMLHDLGLTDFYEDGVTPFEKRGAEVATTELLARGADPAFTELVHDAIALHLDVVAAKGSTARGGRRHPWARRSTSLGLRLDDLSPAFVAETPETQPRLGFAELIIAATREQARRSPNRWWRNT